MKRSEIWVPGVLVENVKRAFELVVFKVIQESFGALFSKIAMFKNLLRQLWDRNFCSYLESLHKYGIHSTLSCSRLFWSNSVLFIKKALHSKTADCRAKKKKLKFWETYWS